jgi:hypothetical protein
MVPGTLRATDSLYYRETIMTAQAPAAARFCAEPIGERFAKMGTRDLYRVACNLVNGLPPRYCD